MCEHSNVSQSAALRRETRKRKILENSTNRLKLIEGISSSMHNSSPETLQEVTANHDAAFECNVHKDVPSNDSVCETTNVNSKLNDILQQSKELKEISDFILQDKKEAGEDEEEEEVEMFIADQDKQVPFHTYLVEKKLHYMFLALFVSALLFLDYGYMFYDNVFCPFYTLKAIELISRRQEKEDLQPILFLVLAGLPASVQKFIKIILSVLSALFTDLLLYLFTFIIGTKILNTWI